MFLGFKLKSRCKTIILLLSYEVPSDDSQKRKIRESVVKLDLYILILCMVCFKIII